MGDIFNFLFALLACAAMTMVLHGCGGEDATPAPAPPAPAPPAPSCPTCPVQPSEVLAEQLCDNGCVVEFKCDKDGGCMRVPNDKCMIKTSYACTHESCQAFRDENIEEQTCSKMYACCAFNSKLTETPKIIDPICDIATPKTGSNFCLGVNFSSEVLGSQLCDGGCVVEIKCDKDGGCIRVPNDKCIIKDTQPCSHHETCQEFKDETTQKKSCSKMTACCKFNSILSGEDKVIDPICSVATPKSSGEETFCPSNSETGATLELV